MYRLAYRNFGDHESLVVNHSVTAGSGVGVRWYELRSPSGTPTVFQQGTFAPDSSYRWMGSVAMDQAGNIALGYSVSSSHDAPVDPLHRPPGGRSARARCAGRGTSSAGAGSQTGSSLSRWGDYSAMTVDPTDDCTFWYTNEYLASTGFNWGTRSRRSSSPAVDRGQRLHHRRQPAGRRSPGRPGASTVSTALVSGTAEAVTLSAAACPAG